MKQIIVTAITVFSFLTGFTQQLNPADKEEYDNLRKRAKAAKVTSVVFASSAGGLTIVGVYCMLFGATLNASGFDEYDENGNKIPNHEGDDVIKTGAIMTAVGTAAGLISIPFFIKEGRLSEEARQIRVRMRSNSINMPVNGMRSVKVPQLQLSFTIPLGS